MKRHHNSDNAERNVTRGADVKYADPWSFRSRPSSKLEPFSDLHGHPAAPRFYRRGGLLAVIASLQFVTEQPSTDVGNWVRRYRSAVVARYRRNGECTEAELRTIEALYLEGLTLRGFARREGVSPSAIGQRLAGLFRKAPEFCNWYRFTRRRATGE